MSPAESEAGADVGHAGAADDERRASLDVAVPDAPRVVVAGLAGGKEQAAQAVAQSPDCRRLDRRSAASPVGCRFRHIEPSLNRGMAGRPAGIRVPPGAGETQVTSKGGRTAIPVSTEGC